MGQCPAKALQCGGCETESTIESRQAVETAEAENARLKKQHAENEKKLAELTAKLAAAQAQ